MYRILQRCTDCTEWLQTELKESDTKNILHIPFLEPRVPNFHPFCSTISRFPYTAHFKMFPFNHMLKFQSTTKCLKLSRLPRDVKYPYSTTIVNRLIKFGCDWMKTRSSFFETYSPMITVLTEISKCHKILKFWQIAVNSNSCIPPTHYHTFHKVCFKLDEKSGSSSVF